MSPTVLLLCAIFIPAALSTSQRRIRQVESASPSLTTEESSESAPTDSMVSTTDKSIERTSVIPIQSTEEVASVISTNLLNVQKRSFSRVLKSDDNIEKTEDFSESLEIISESAESKETAMDTVEPTKNETDILELAESEETSMHVMEHAKSEEITIDNSKLTKEKENPTIVALTPELQEDDGADFCKEVIYKIEAKVSTESEEKDNQYNDNSLENDFNTKKVDTELDDKVNVEDVEIEQSQVLQYISHPLSLSHLIGKIQPIRYSLLEDNVGEGKQDESDVSVNDQDEDFKEIFEITNEFSVVRENKKDIPQSFFGYKKHSVMLKIMFSMVDDNE